jgi:hypothetical protein
MTIRTRLRRRTPWVGLSLSLALASAMAWAPSAVADPGSTSLVSVASDGTQGNDPSSDPASSSDGRVVAFDSLATNLVAGDTNAEIDVFVRDRQTAETTRVSVASDGAQGSSEFGFSQGADASISADGRFVAFQAGFTNLVAGDTNSCVSLPNLPLVSVPTSSCTTARPARPPGSASPPTTARRSDPAPTRRSALTGSAWRSPPMPAIWCAWIATGSGMSSCATAKREPPCAPVSPPTARRPTTRAPFPPSAPTGCGGLLFRGDQPRCWGCQPNR